MEETVKDLKRELYVCERQNVQKSFTMIYLHGLGVSSDE